MEYMKNGDKCDKKRCLKEINPEAHPGVFMGTPFVYEDFWMACVLCTEIEGYQPFSELDKPEVLKLGVGDKVREIPLEEEKREESENPYQDLLNIGEVPKKKGLVF
jgi:hypothetical protein